MNLLFYMVVMQLAVARELNFRLVTGLEICGKT
jgi:hypothetical protein